jgi:hypothetical protein
MQFGRKWSLKNTESHTLEVLDKSWRTLVYLKVAVMADALDDMYWSVLAAQLFSLSSANKSQWWS